MYKNRRDSRVELGGRGVERDPTASRISGLSGKVSACVRCLVFDVLKGFRTSCEQRAAIEVLVLEILVERLGRLIKQQA